MEGLLNLIRREIARAVKPAPSRAALIDSYDQKAHAVKVRFQPDDILSGWIPICTQNIGSDHGVLVGPEIGAQVIVGHLEGDVEAAFIQGRIYSDQERPPEVASGDILIKHKSGQKTLMSTDGSVTTTLADGTTMKLETGKATTQLPDGTMVRLSGGKVYLGAEGGPAVMTEAGPSTVVFAKV